MAAASLLALPIGFGLVSMLVRQARPRPEAVSVLAATPPRSERAPSGQPRSVEPDAPTTPSSAISRPRQAAPDLKPCPIDGTWSNKQMSLLIDCSSRTAGTDIGPSPVRSPLTIQDVTAGWVVFDIGRDRYFGLLAGTTMSVTSVGSRGEQVLVRKDGPRATGK